MRQELPISETEYLFTETWHDEWSDSFDGTYGYTREEAALIGPDGLVGAYTEAENSDETYAYSGTYEYGWIHALVEGGGGEGGGGGTYTLILDPVKSGTRSATFTEGLTIHWLSAYDESGVLGPGGSVGVYESSDGLTLDYECSGGRAMSLVYQVVEQEGVDESHTADETWTFSGGDHYRCYKVFEYSHL